MKALVTGGNGFLGSFIVRKLLARGHSVRVLHRKNSDLSALSNLNFESVLGDVTDLESVMKACSGIEAIFHTAALIAYSSEDYSKMEQVNVEGTKNVVEAALFAHVKRLVHTSSMVAVGASYNPEILNENSPFQMQKFHLGYYNTKFQAEELVRKAVKNKKLNAVIVNPTIMFGPGDFAKSTRQFYLKVAEGKIPFFPPGGVNVCGVEDVVEGHMLAFEKGRAGERYILGGENISLKDMFGMLAEAGGHKRPLLRIPPTILRTPHYFENALRRFGKDVSLKGDSPFVSTLYHWYDISKARLELDYAPSSAKLAIEKSVRWGFENGILKRA